MFYLLTIIPDNRFAFVCSIFNIVPEQSCSLVSGGGLEGQKGLSAVVWSQVKGEGVQHPCCASLPKALSLKCCPMGIKSAPGAQLGLGCWCAQQDGHFPGTAMLPSTSTAGGRGNKRVSHGFGMPDDFSCLNHLPVASCTLGSTSSKGCHSRQPLPELLETAVQDGTNSSESVITLGACPDTLAQSGITGLLPFPFPSLSPSLPFPIMTCPKIYSIASCHAH